MMVIAVGLSQYALALFHLVNHAFYKALLFLGAGSVIHSVSDNQDFRRYGGLRPFLPLTYSVMLIASLSLVAFPFMTGFYSKDFILESAYGQYNYSATVVYIIATIGAMFTTLYSVKVLYLTFLTNPNGPLINYKQAHEGDIFMSSPLMILAVFSIFFGFITKDMFIGLGSAFFSDNALFIHPSHEIMLDTEFGVPTLFKLLPLIFTISLIVIAIVLSEYLSTILIYFKLSRVGYNIFSFFNQRFLIELFYNIYITGNILILGGQTTKVIDKGSVEYLGPYGLEKGLSFLSNIIGKLSNGMITSYALYILTGLMLYLLFSSYIYNSIYILTLSMSLCILLFTITSYYGSIRQNYILQSSSINPSSDSDTDMEDYSDRPDTPPVVRARNERDLETIENLQRDNQGLRDLFTTGEKLRDHLPTTEDEYGTYVMNNSPTLNELETRITQNEREIERLEDRMVERREPDYDPSEDESSSSQSSVNNNSRPVSPETTDSRPVSPESSSSGSGFYETRSPLSETRSPLSETRSPLSEVEYMDTYIDSLFPIIQDVFSDSPFISMTGLFYRLYKMSFFKALMFWLF